MAFISCPKCGNHNIVDTSETCPQCGFEIKNITKSRGNEISKNENQDYPYELKQKMKQIDDEPYPEKPTFIKIMFNPSEGGKLTYWLFAIIIISLLLGVFGKNTFFIFVFAISLIIGLPIMLFLSYSDYKMFLEEYYNEIKDWEGLKNKRKKQLIESYKNNECDDTNKAYLSYCPKCGYQGIYETGKEKCPFCGTKELPTQYEWDKWLLEDAYPSNLEEIIFNDYIKNNPNFDEDMCRCRENKEKLLQQASLDKQIKQPNTPKCPICQSTDVQKLSTMSKVLGVGLLGFASKTVGKTYKCNNCGYYW